VVSSRGPAPLVGLATSTRCKGFPALMIDILILADDLSGAADCASSCLRSGRKPIVLLDPWADPGDATVVAVDINSRAKSPQEAGAAMAAQVERLLSHQTRILYQKMDSTLRGNWAQRPHACSRQWPRSTGVGRSPSWLLPSSGRSYLSLRPQSPEGDHPRSDGDLGAGEAHATCRTGRLACC
jgi:hypothetical protein